MKSNGRNSPLSKINILLADDDKDDCVLFKAALEELPISFNLTVVHHGQQLMQILTKNSSDPFDVLFLDLNMPRKDGFLCLNEIKGDKNLMHLPVIIFSTSFDASIVDSLYKNGALHYIRKPVDFSQLKKVIEQALLLIEDTNISPLPREKFS